MEVVRRRFSSSCSVRLRRYDDAIKAFRRYLIDVAPEGLSCPSLLQLYQMAGDFEQLKQMAKQQSDPLSYLAALIQEERVRGDEGRGRGRGERKSREAQRAEGTGFPSPLFSLPSAPLLRPQGFSVSVLVVLVGSGIFS